MNFLKDLKIDPSAAPATLDQLHIALAAAVAALLLLTVILLLIMVVSLFGRLKKRVPAEAKVVEKVIETPAPAKPAPAPEAVILKEATPDAALQLLSLLQQEARFVDFVQENIASYSDAEIGAAARVVHEGCAKVMKEHFSLEPVRNEAETSRITLPKGFDASSVRMTGNIVGEPPFTGTLIHKGWRVTGVTLPKIAQGHNVHIVAAAEVEL